MVSDDTISEDYLLGKLKAAGLRITLPRRLISRVMAESHSEFINAATILERVASSAGRIDASTVYRTLDEMESIGLVHHVHLGQQPGTWHLSSDDDHQHLVCEECGKTTLVPWAEVEPIYRLFTEKYGFHAGGNHLAILGHCADDCDEPPGHPHASNDPTPHSEPTDKRGRDSG